MIRILKEPERLKKYIAERDLCLFLEYDGTLVPTAERAEKAVLSKEAKLLLSNLASLRSCNVYVISGRSLKDMKTKVPLKGVGYVGNHGFEIDSKGISFENFGFEDTRQVLIDIKNEIRNIIARFSGAYIEDKSITLSVHYRLVNAELAKELCATLNDIVKPFLIRGEVSVDLGNKVFEIKPPVDWDKGQSVLWILDQYEQINGRKSAAIFIGDDQMDEDVFRSLKGKALIIKVGAGQTIAEYFVQEQSKVIDLLKVILSFKRKGWFKCWRFQ